MVILLSYTPEQITGIIGAIVSGIVAIISAISTLLNNRKPRTARKAKKK